MESSINQDRMEPGVVQESARKPSRTPSSAPLRTNIELPAHLLATVSDHNEWTVHERSRRQQSPRRSDSRKDFDVVRMAYEQKNRWQRHVKRAHSVTVAGLSRGVAPGPSGRTNSSPIADTKESHRERSSLPNLSSETLSPALAPSTTIRDNLDSSEAPVRTTVPAESLPGNTILFTKLSNYNLSSPRKSRTSLPEEVDPFTDSSSVLTTETDPFRDQYSMFADDDELPAEDDGHSTTAPDGPGRTSRVFSRIREDSIIHTAAEAIINAVQTATAEVSNTIRKSSLHDLYEKAKLRGNHLQRKKYVQVLFEYFVYLLTFVFIYFVLVGVPLWKGATWWLYWVVDHKFVVPGTWAVTIGLAIIYAFAPLLILFEKEPPMPADDAEIDATKTPGVHNVALMIPCYKSANIVGPTLEAALKIFPPDHIFVVANGNSPTPLDNTEEVCRQYGVNHIWSPIGSKIVAQFVGCYAVKHFENVLLIDDDCALPPNFPIISDRLTEQTKCIGYTIKSVGPNSSKGTLCCQAQDLEYKLSGLQRQFAGMIGSATFPHGAISLWNTKFLIKTFYAHPGFSVSEDWFFGHVARELGSRIKMCSAIFVETETPSAVLFSSGGSRGGFGEMTIFKQRFYRWNFFFVNGMYYNMAYILGSWKLGFWEFGAKLFVFQEVYETLLYLVAPFMLPISLIVRPAFCGYLTAGTFALYFLNVTIFNEIHLRLRNERVGFVALYVYYMPYKFVLTLINVASCYWSLYKYAKYFAKRHPKVIEDEKAVEVVLRLEEKPASSLQNETIGRRMTVTSVGVRLNSHDGRLSRVSEDLGLEERMQRPLEVHVSPRSPVFQADEMGNPRTWRPRPFRDPQMQTDVADFAFRQPQTTSALVRKQVSKDFSFTTRSSSLARDSDGGRPLSWEYADTLTSDYGEDCRKVSSARSMA